MKRDFFEKLSSCKKKKKKKEERQLKLEMRAWHCPTL